jgi:hypothetical protein
MNMKSHNVAMKYTQSTLGEQSKFNNTATESTRQSDWRQTDKHEQASQEPVQPNNHHHD